jgi:hypothetical protein
VSSGGLSVLITEKRIAWFQFFHIFHLLVLFSRCWVVTLLNPMLKLAFSPKAVNAVRAVDAVAAVGAVGAVDAVGLFSLLTLLSPL